MIPSLCRASAALLAGAVFLLSGVAFSQGSSESVWLLPIDTEITPATAQYVQSRVERANEERPLALVFLIDTPGGQVSSMQEIVDTILSDTRLPTIAVVENAFSAGALIAMSAEMLAMLPGSSIGAALPITISPTGVSAVGEKMNSAMRGQFRSVAEARGRNARVAEAMVDPSVEIPGLSTSEELVTLTAAQAVEYDIADIQASTLEEALTEFGYGGVRIERIERNLSERLATSLANPIIAAILLVLGIGGILVEIFTPGFGVPGGIGIVALALLAAGAYLATPAGIFDVVLVLGGIVLIALEVLVIPGFGVAGLLGIAAVGVALFRIFQDDFVAVLGWTVLFAGVLIGLAIWLLPNLRIASPLMLETRLGKGGYTPGTPLASDSPYDHLRGQTGIAASDLRPAGVARIAGERVDVVTQGDFVSSGSLIEVMKVEGNRIVVREVVAEVETEAGAEA
ncbi:MAG TPA: NfeD family protein [Trueperaceae bacterium]